MTDVAVRRVRRGDGARLAAVWLDNARYYAQLDPGSFRVPDADGLEQWCEDVVCGPRGDDELAIVAELDGVVVGSLEARVVAPVTDAHRQMVAELGVTRLVIDALGVERSAWRRGAGGALVAAAEDWGRSRGAVMSCVSTYARSPVSVAFYEHGLGYAPKSVDLRKRLR